MKYQSHYSTKKTPQSQPIPGRSMLPNAAGGHVFELDKWERLNRFLILGTEGGTYYVGEQELTVENSENLTECIKTDGKRVVDAIVEVSKQGRAPKNDAAIFALAVASGLGDQETKKYALSKLGEVCRTGTHLFAFLDAVQNFRGWGRGLRQAVAHWYDSKPIDKLAMQLVKYRQRGGWTHRDAFRLSHPIVGDDKQRQALYNFAVKGVECEHADDLPDVVKAYIAAQTAPIKDIPALIEQFGLPREALPTEALNSKDVWKALNYKMPIMATLRNLGNMGKCGLLAPLALENHVVIDRFIAGSGATPPIHPLQWLVAAMTYGQGAGMRGKGEWPVVPQIVTALNDAFDNSFRSIKPTGKRFIIAVDVSGSMSGEAIANMPYLSLHMGAAAMSLAVMRSEPNHHLIVFDTQVYEAAITASFGIKNLCDAFAKIQGGGTDIAAPIDWAISKNIECDAFVIYTDNETWAGRTHPQQAFEKYLRLVNPDAKCVVVSMSATKGSVGDPKHPAVLNIVGFDTSVPQVIQEFVGAK